MKYLEKIEIAVPLGVIHKGRPRRGCEGDCRDPDKLGHREGGLTQQPGRPSLNKKEQKICFRGIKRY